MSTSTPVNVSAFEAKSFDRPDESRTPEKTRVDVVRVGGYSLARLTLQPGWRWSECIRPVVGTDSCQVSHVGYVVSGRMTVRLDDGSQKSVGPGEAYTIPPGHDAWVEGGEQVVALEVLSAEQFAKPQG